MKKSLKRILSFFLCVFMLLPSMPVSAEIFTEGLYQYSVEDGKATIIKYIAPNESVRPGTGVTVRIPKQLGGYPVVSIGTRAFPQHNIKCIIIPDSVISIQVAAFDECRVLTDIVIPDSVERIGSGAFFHTHISRIVIPTSVTCLEDQFFEGCHELKEVYYMGDAPQFKKEFMHASSEFTSYYLTDAAGWENVDWNGHAYAQMDKFYDEGDINSNQKVDLDDARSALRIALELDCADAIQMLAADMDGDGTVSLKDAQTILRTVLNLDSI